MMNGNLSTWTDLDLPTETHVNDPILENSFGTTIPSHPEINISMPEDAIREQEKGLKLISNRA